MTVSSARKGADSTMTGAELTRLFSAYRKFCALSNQPTDVRWLVENLACHARYLELDLLVELEKCLDWWSDQKKAPKSSKRAIRNWMKKAAEFKAEQPTVLAPLPETPFVRVIDGKVLMADGKGGELEVHVLGDIHFCPAMFCRHRAQTLDLLQEHYDERHRGRE